MEFQTVGNFAMAISLILVRYNLSSISPHGPHNSPQTSVYTMTVCDSFWIRLLDFSDVFKQTLGYHGDVNGTYPVGEIDEDSQRLIRATRECLDEAIKICKPGALIRDIGKVMYVTVLPCCLIAPSSD